MVIAVFINFHRGSDYSASLLYIRIMLRKSPALVTKLLGATTLIPLIF